jgi:hypothetical protein
LICTYTLIRAQIDLVAGRVNTVLIVAVGNKNTGMEKHNVLQSY